MRIALLSHQFPGVRLGGIGVYTLNCARALAEAGHDAHLFTFPIPTELRAALPSKILLHEVADLAERGQSGAVPAPLAAAIHAGGEATYRLALGALLCAKVREVHAATPFDVIEAPEYEALALPLIVSPIPGLPVVTHLHSGSAIVHRAGQQALTGDQLLFEAMEAAAILAADARCAPSERVIADTKESVDFDGSNALRLPFYPSTKGETSPPRAGAPIVFIGRLETIKGAHLLPEALNIFLHEQPQAIVRLIGPDTNTSLEQSSMAQWISARLDASVKDRVTFVGEQTHQQLASELAAASFTIVPSLHDSYSYVCCESLAAARPVIVSDSIGATEVVGDGGISFERGNPKALAAAMSRLYTDAPLLQRLSQAAKRRADSVLAPSATTQQRVTFYQELIARGPSTVSLTDRLANLPSAYTAPLLQAFARLTTFLAGVPDPAIETPGMRLVRIMNTIASGQPVKVLLYGAGRHTSRLLAEKHLWESAGHAVVGLIDDHPRFQGGGTHLGLPVESVATLQARLPLANCATAMVLSTDTFQDQFWQQTESLRKAGLRVFKLYE
jgi:glycosyltransferase involved in cell wall biosynthesis